MTAELSTKVGKYNNLVQEWNTRFGNICQGMPIKYKKIRRQSKIDRLKLLFTDEMSEKRKLSHTVTIIGDFKKMKCTNINNKALNRGELAYIIVKIGKKILSLI